MNGEATANTKLSFQLVPDPKILISVLQERHPYSCFMYNQVISHSRFKDDITFYTYGKEINSTTWITSINTQKGHSKQIIISISAPCAILEGREQIPLDVKEAFLSGDLINWDEGVLFAALEKPVSRMIFDISVNVLGNITEVHPCILFYMDKEDALNLEINPCTPNVKVQRLPVDSGTDFILSTWKYPQAANVPQCIAANASGGVFVDGECVSGVITTGAGLISALYTLKEHRNKGYAKLTMKNAFKETAKDGGIPCLTVELRNAGSIAFHQSLGVKQASIVDWIDIKVLDVD